MGESVKSRVEALLGPLEERGYEIWNVEYAREGRERQLRVYVDKEGGIGVDDCEVVSRWLSDVLDAEDFIGEAYSLVVSSPGMDRVLVKEEHFERYAGRAVEVALYKGFEGRKKFTAILEGKTEKEIIVTPVGSVTGKKNGEAETLRIPVELVSKVNLMVEF